MREEGLDVIGCIAQQLLALLGDVRQLEVEAVSSMTVPFMTKYCPNRPCFPLSYHALCSLMQLENSLQIPEKNLQHSKLGG